MYLLIFDSVFLEFYYCGHSIYMDFTSFFFISKLKMPRDGALPLLVGMYIIGKFVCGPCY